MKRSRGIIRLVLKQQEGVDSGEKELPSTSCSLENGELFMDAKTLIDANCRWARSQSPFHFQAGLDLCPEYGQCIAPFIAKPGRGSNSIRRNGTSAGPCRRGMELSKIGRIISSY